jgi:hypothetical protein
MGLCGLFMVLGGEGVMEDLPLGNMPEMQWGSTDSRYNTVHIESPICVSFCDFRGALFRMVLMFLFFVVFNFFLRESYVQQRQMMMSIHALMTYLDSNLSGECALLDRYGQVQGPDLGPEGSNKGVPSGTGPVTVTAQSFASIFQADDKVMANSHMTEFWY